MKLTEENTPASPAPPEVTKEDVLAVAKVVGETLKTLEGLPGMTHRGSGKPRAWTKHGMARWYFEVTTTWEGRAELNRFYVDLYEGRVGQAQRQIISGFILDHLNQAEYPKLARSAK